MPSIKFNHFTKEIELKGTEGFIKSNFNMIQDPLIGRNGTRKKMVSRNAETTHESMSTVAIAESKPSLELRATRPPQRKYIRKVGAPGQQQKVIEVIEQKPKELTLASLKEKFGLSDTKLGETVPNAEKFGNIRRSMNGPYA